MDNDADYDGGLNVADVLLALGQPSNKKGRDEEDNGSVGTTTASAGSSASSMPAIDTDMEGSSVGASKAPDSGVTSQARECSTSSASSSASSSGGVQGQKGQGRGQTRSRAEFEKSPQGPGSRSGSGRSIGAGAGAGAGAGSQDGGDTGTETQHSSYEGMLNTQQLVRTELLLLSALGRRPNRSSYSSGSSVHFGNSEGHDAGYADADDEEQEQDPDESDEHLQERLILAANRGKYRCSRCGAPKTNHNCPVVEQYTISGCSQYEAVTLSAAEFNGTYVSKSVDASISSIASISLSNCLRLVPVRSHYVPAVPAHALRKPARARREPTNVSAADAASAATPEALLRPPSAPRVIPRDEYVVDPTGISSINAITRLPPGLVYIPVPTALLQSGLGVHLTATSFSGEALGVFSLAAIGQDKDTNRKERESHGSVQVSLSFQPAAHRPSPTSGSSSSSSSFSSTGAANDVGCVGGVGGRVVLANGASGNGGTIATAASRGVGVGAGAGAGADTDTDTDTDAMDVSSSSQQSSHQQVTNLRR